MNLVSFSEDRATLHSLTAAAIARYGFLPDHQLAWFEYGMQPGEYDPCLFHWPDGTGVMAYREPKQWTFVVEPLAPPELSIERFLEAAAYALAYPGSKKIVVEYRQEPRRHLLAALPAAGLRARALNYALSWPVHDLTVFDPDLGGGHWKTIRKEHNRFYREHAVSIVDATTVPKKDLHILMDEWGTNRPARDRMYNYMYHNLVDGNFEGMTSARAFFVDGVICGLNAGWIIPNSDDTYYGGIGLHNYRYSELGDMVYLEDLVWLKKNGYKKVDMGGSWGGPITFKQKFAPTSWYKSYVFSVVRA